jgi:Ca2+-binding EF-hand superfamily protein
LIDETAGKHSSLPERFVAVVMQQLMLAIAHVHARGVVHLDLKSANIMLMPQMPMLPPGRTPERRGFTLADVNAAPHVMLIDLGVAQIFRPGDFRSNDPIGTPVTMAAEVWNGEITPKADIFSCGVVFFEQLSLTLPFSPGMDRERAIRYWSTKPQAPWPLIQHCSNPALVLCRWMLTLERSDRPTAFQCLQTSFLQLPKLAQDSEDMQCMVRLLADFSRTSLLYKSIALRMARSWPANQLPSVKRFFHELDAQNTGCLSKEQLQEALQSRGLTPALARESSEAMDLSRDGMVWWTEFVAACIDLGSAVYEQNLERFFKEADSDGDNLLSQQDLTKMLASADLREESAPCELFILLVGRAEEGARLDWPTFRAHFRSSRQGSRPGLVGVHDRNAASGGSVQISLFQKADSTDAPEQATPPLPEEPSEEKLQQLARMGFADRDKCIAALKKWRNSLDFAVQELVEEQALVSK